MCAVEGFEEKVAVERGTEKVEGCVVEIELPMQQRRQPLGSAAWLVVVVVGGGEW